MSAKYKYDKIPMLTKKKKIHTIILLTEPFKLLIHLQTHFKISQLLNLGKKKAELKKTSCYLVICPLCIKPKCMQ